MEAGCSRCQAALCGRCERSPWGRCLLCRSRASTASTSVPSWRAGEPRKAGCPSLLLRLSRLLARLGPEAWTSRCEGTSELHTSAGSASSCRRGPGSFRQWALGSRVLHQLQLIHGLGVVQMTPQPYLALARLGPVAWTSRCKGTIKLHTEGCNVASIPMLSDQGGCWAGRRMMLGGVSAWLWQLCAVVNTSRCQGRIARRGDCAVCRWNGCAPAHRVLAERIRHAAPTSLAILFPLPWFIILLFGHLTSRVRAPPAGCVAVAVKCEPAVLLGPHQLLWQHAGPRRLPGGAACPSGGLPPLRTARRDQAAARTWTDDLRGDEARCISPGLAGSARAACFAPSCHGSMQDSLAELLPALLPCSIVF